MTLAVADGLDYASDMRMPLILLLFSWCAIAMAEVYKWVDEEGIHYGDKPPSKEAKPVKLPEVSGYKPRPLPGASGKGSGDLVNADPDKTFAGYQQLSITSPTNDQTLRANDGVVRVSISLVPALQEGHVLSLLLDGRPVADTGDTNRVIENVDRGSHTLVAVVSDNQGKQLISSVQIRFFLHRASVLQRQER